MRYARIVLLGLLAALVLVLRGEPMAVASAGDVYVDAANAGDPLEDGSLAHPFDQVQEGIDAALSGDTVSVAPGTYYERISMKSGLTVQGAGADLTTIDGGGAGSVVTATNAGAGAKLDGFTITNGSSAYGGAGSTSVIPP